MMRTVTKAIIRKPGPGIAGALHPHGPGTPDPEAAVAQHKAYVWELFVLGIEPEMLPADPAFPDGCFVEDCAVVTEKGAILCRPGHPSRRGEVDAIAEVLRREMPVGAIEAPGTVDGGDVLRAEDHFFIGLSERTNEAGAKQLAEKLRELGFTASTVPVGQGLHLKSAVSYAGDGRIVVADGFALPQEFEKFERIVTAPEERYAANLLAINGKLIVSKGFPRLLDQLQALDYPVTALDMSEFRKVDGSLTCLSLLW